MPWRSFNSYRDDELRVLEFPSTEELERCVALFYDDPDLRGCPSDSYDGETLWVPVEVADIIVKRGIVVIVHIPMSYDKLTPEMRGRLKRTSRL